MQLWTYSSKGLLLLFTFSLGLTLGCGTANASTVSKVTGDRVIVDITDGDDVSEGSRFIVVVGGKKRAVIEITKVKGAKASAKVLKGKAAEGGELTPLAAATKKSSSSASSPSSGSKRSRRSNQGPFSDMTYGALVGYDMGTQSVTAGGTSISMTGSGFSLKGFGDIPISGALGLLGRLGATQFSVKGSAAGTEYKTDIMYATADLLLRYNFGETGFVPYGIAGLGLHFPISKSSNVLDTQRISATTVFFAGGGFHYTLSETSFFTGTLEYGMFPPSNDVTTSMISARGGLGWSF